MIKGVPIFDDEEQMLMKLSIDGSNEYCVISKDEHCRLFHLENLYGSVDLIPNEEKFTVYTSNAKLEARANELSMAFYRKE